MDITKKPQIMLILGLGCITLSFIIAIGVIQEALNTGDINIIVTTTVEGMSDLQPRLEVWNNITLNYD